MTHFVELHYSDDGGHNYGQWQERESGDTGSFLKRLIWRRLGRVKEERIWEFRDASPVAATVIAAFID